MRQNDNTAVMLESGGLLDGLLDRALQYHQRGEFARAESLYREVLQQDPQHAEALHGLAVLLARQEHYESAAELLQQAITYKPWEVDFHNDYGIVCMRQGQFAAAIAAYQSALRLQPGRAETHYNLGVVYHKQGNLAAAKMAYQDAVRWHPDYAPAHYNLGVVMCLQGDYTAAVTAYQAVLRSQPEHLEAQYNLGVAQHYLGQLPAAAAAYEAVLRQQPEHVRGQHNLGVIQQQLGNYAAAVRSFREALRLQPTHAGASYNLGKVLYRQGELAAARAAYITSLQYQPAHADAQNELGVVLQALGDLPGAMQAYEAALRLQPDCAEAQWNRALLSLGMGSLAPGWAAYEWRWRVSQRPVQAIPYPRWDGTALAERTLLVHAESTGTDEVLFASCVPDVIARAAHVVVACDSGLAPLLQRSFPTATVSGSDRRADRDWLTHIPAIDVHVPLGSLPARWRAQLACFPGRQGYLIPSAVHQEQWQTRLTPLGPGLTVGIAWHSPAEQTHSHSAMRLEEWGAVFSVPGIHWVSLEADADTAELTTARQQWGIDLHTWLTPEAAHDIDGLAALIACLDLIIAPDTMVAALAGGLGQPVWRLSTADCHWEMLGTDMVPWFPSMRPYRQARIGDWAGVLQQIAVDLRQLTAPLPVI